MEMVKTYVSAREKQLNMVFQFDAVDVGREPFDDPYAKLGYRLQDFKAAIARTQHIMTDSDAWATAFLENHGESSRHQPQHAHADTKLKTKDVPSPAFAPTHQSSAKHLQECWH